MAKASHSPRSSLADARSPRRINGTTISSTSSSSARPHSLLQQPARFVPDSSLEGATRGGDQLLDRESAPSFSTPKDATLMLFLGRKPKHRRLRWLVEATVTL